MIRSRKLSAAAFSSGSTRFTESLVSSTIPSRKGRFSSRAKSVEMFHRRLIVEDANVVR